MIQTRLLSLPPPSPRSTTSSWAPSTVHFVSPHDEQISDISILCRFHAFMTNPHRCTTSSSAVFISFTGLLSLVGNCILLLVAYHKRSTLKPAEFFIINLSVSDLGMTLSLFPLAIPSAFAHRYLIISSKLSMLFLPSQETAN